MALSTENTEQLTQEQVHSLLTEPLERFSTFLESGPTFFDTNGGNAVRVPTIGAHNDEQIASDNWHGQNEQISEIDPDFGELLLLPNTIESIKTLTRFSNELARQSVIALDQALQNRLVTDVARAMDRQLLSDDDGMDGGVKVKPAGMFSWDVEEIEHDGLELDTIMDAYGLFLGVRGHVDNLRLFIRPDDYMELRKLKDNDGRYLLEPDVSSGSIVVPALGATLAVSRHIPEGQAALVDMQQVAVARDLDPTVTILDQTFGDYDQQAIRVVARYDTGLMDPNAMVKLTAATGGVEG